MKKMCEVWLMSMCACANSFYISFIYIKFRFNPKSQHLYIIHIYTRTHDHGATNTIDHVNYEF